MATNKPLQPEEVSETLQQIRVDLEALPDPKTRESVLLLLNLVESLVAEVVRLREENERLKQHGQTPSGDNPPHPPPGKPPRDFSSEKERRKLQSRKKQRRTPKKPNLPIHDERICPVDRQELPPDAKFHGYEEVVVQDIIIRSNNIRFYKEVFYSPAFHKTFRGQVPSGYEGDFGPHLKAAIIAMKFEGGMSEPKIHRFLMSFGVQISKGSISHILLNMAERFHQDKDDLYRAGRQSTCYQQIDDTSATVNGEGYHTHIVCNPWYTAYFTTPRKDRLTVIDVLRGFAPRRYRFNNETFELLKQFHVSQKIIAQLADIPRDRDFSQDEMDRLLTPLFPGESGTHRQHILEAAAIVSFHHDRDFPPPAVLVSDDASQFKRLARLALCWIHEGRHYKKLSPVVPLHQEQLAAFRQRYWEYYGNLKQYQASPSPIQAHVLSEDFDQLFSPQTGYHQLDERIAKTRAKKERLLTVLDFPEVPLHNNASELGARVSARRRDVSLQTKNERGTRAMDTYTTIVETARKLGVSAYEYFYDRIAGIFAFPSLAELIRLRRGSPAVWQPS